MKIDKNEAFRVLAKIKGLEYEQFNKLIVRELESINIFLEEEDKGIKLWEVLRAYDTCIDVIIVPLMGTTSLNFASLFAELVVFGNGDCEACGGELIEENEEVQTLRCEHCSLIYEFYE